jgi:hypothetical protein
MLFNLVIPVRIQLVRNFHKQRRFVLYLTVLCNWRFSGTFHPTDRICSAEWSDVVTMKQCWCERAKWRFSAGSLLTFSLEAVTSVLSEPSNQLPTNHMTDRLTSYLADHVTFKRLIYNTVLCILTHIPVLSVIIMCFYILISKEVMFDMAF